MPPHVAVIINPIAGAGSRMDVARERAERAASLVAGRGLDAQVLSPSAPATPVS